MQDYADKVTIMFSDVAGSTQLYEKLGNRKAQTLVARCLKKIMAITEQYQGGIVKTIGDEVMSIFAHPESAASAAICQQEITGTDPELLQHLIQFRIGFHHGQAIYKKNDVFGDGVNVAARVAGLSKANQILTTGTTIKHLSEEQYEMTRMVDQTRVKGKRDPIKLYELSWGKPEELTIVGTFYRDLTIERDRGPLSLRLSFYGETYRIDQGAPTLSMGRDSSNTITINDPRVSRLHAGIELRKESFILSDKSTNGTFLYPKNDPMIMLRRDEIKLPRAGSISLGYKIMSGCEDVITFAV